MTQANGVLKRPFSHVLEVLLQNKNSFSSTMQLQNFCYASEEEARAVFDAVTKAISDNVDRHNSAPRVVEIVDRMGRLSVPIENVVSVRMIDADVMDAISDHRAQRGGQMDAIQERAKAEAPVA